MESVTRAAGEAGRCDRGSACCGAALFALQEEQPPGLGSAFSPAIPGGRRNKRDKVGNDSS